MHDKCDLGIHTKRLEYKIAFNGYGFRAKSHEVEVPLWIFVSIQPVCQFLVSFWLDEGDRKLILKIIKRMYISR